MAKDMRFAMLYDFYKQFLTEKQADVMDLYYNEDLSLAEISVHSGVTRQGVRDNIKRAEAVLTEMEQKMGVLAYYDKMMKTFEQVNLSVEEILDFSARNGLYHVEREAKKIKTLLLEVADGI